MGKKIQLACSKYSFSEGDAINLIVRPEMMRIKKSGEIFEGVIRRSVYLGDCIEYDIEVGGNLLTGAENDPNILDMFPEGEKVTVGIAENCVQILPASS